MNHLLIDVVVVGIVVVSKQPSNLTLEKKNNNAF